MLKSTIEYIGSWFYKYNNTQTDILDLQNELLTDIFQRLPYGKDRLNFSLVCVRFSLIAATNMSPIDRLIHNKYKEILFSQKNRICTFITVGLPENKPGIVMTADNACDVKNPLVTLWENGHAPVTEKTIGRSKTDHDSSDFSSFFQNPIFSLAIGGPSDNYLAAAERNVKGRIQIWDIKKQIKVLEKKTDEEIVGLCGTKNELFIGFENSWVQISRFPDLSVLKRWNVGTSLKLEKIFVDSSIQRLFTVFNSSLKIWDTQNFQCLKEIDDIWKSFVYDSKSQYFIHGNQSYGRKVTLRRAKDGTEIATWTDSEQYASLTTTHVDAESGLLFAAFRITIPSLNKHFNSKYQAKLTIWDTKTKQFVISFLTTPTAVDDWVLCRINQIDFDPKSQLILTQGNEVSLWNLNGKLVKTFSLLDSVRKVSWEKEAERLFILTNWGELRLIDYSRSPFEILDPNSNFPD